LDVDVIEPEAGMYVVARLGPTHADDGDLRQRLLNRAGIAVLPFFAFGASKGAGWFRFSVGATELWEISHALTTLPRALTTYD
jgi:aspartate aminotransferase